MNHHIIGETYVVEGQYAKTYRQRRKGLAGIELDLAPDELVFENCRSIHTFGMKFDLEVLFLDRTSKILGHKTVPKRRIIFAPKGTYSIVERPLR